MPDLVFATSGEARGLGSGFWFEPYEPTNSTSHSSFCDIWSSGHFISNLATGRAEWNGAERVQVMGGAGESGR